MPLDAAVAPWIVRVQTFSFRGTDIELALGHDLFSSAAVDVGTSRLLRALERQGGPLSQEPGRPLRVLDLGCGVGPLGVAIARSMPCGTVETVLCDRDRLATAVAQLNCRLNGLPPGGGASRVLAAGCGYEPCRAAGEGPFDLIVSNVPAKTGERGLEELLFGAGPLLRPGGVVAFVHVAPLAGAIDGMRALCEREIAPLEVLHESAGREHRALFWCFPQGLPARPHQDPLFPWRRPDGRTTAALGASPPFPWTAVKDVDEFESPHHRTPLLARLARQALPEAAGGARILAMNPEHGFLPALLLEARRPAEIALLGRDTLAELAARANLEAAILAWDRTGETRLVPAPAQDALPWLPAPASDERPGYDLIAGPLLWKEGPRALEATLRAYAAALRPDGQGLLLSAVGVGQLEGLKRLARAAGLVHGREARHKGFAALCLRRPSR